MPAAADAAVVLAPAPSPVEAPPPELGLNYGAFTQARVWENCALRYHEDPIVAETLAVDFLMGKPYVQNLDKVFDPPAKAAARPKLQPDTPEQLDLRNRYHKAVALAEPHTPTQDQIAAQVKVCLYAKEIGLVPADLVERYTATFVEVACLQRQFTGPDGKLDAVAHANAAAEVFGRNRMSAGEMTRLGMVFGRYPHVQARVHAAKAQKCPDPRVAEEARRTTGEWNGNLTGDRLGALNLHADTGRLKGAVQWQGATVKYADGAAETQAIAVEGQLSGDRVTLFGDFHGDWVRLQGERKADRLSGTWQAQRAGLDKFKGDWSADRVPEAATAPTPTSP
ncbi:MAG: hypothetical protein FJ100_17790 [Deltaproteobacteria bacterium]|nr:hypothetical protein [Deltaproteobacteria bacterium]